MSRIIHRCFFFSKNISVNAIFNDRKFNDMLTKDIIIFEQLGLELVTNNKDLDQIVGVRSGVNSACNQLGPRVNSSGSTRPVL